MKWVNMQFVLLVCQGTTPLPGTPEWEALPAAERNAVYRDYQAFNELDQVTPGLPLGAPEQARTVTVSDGNAHVAHGTYAGAQWAAGGYSVVEVESMADAVALAARIPAARLGGAVEIRPVAKYW